MRRALYIASMIVVVPLIALASAALTFIVCINTGIDCAKEWE